jgi:hypothetical protein
MASFFEEWNRLRDALSTPGEAEFRALQIVLRSTSSAGYGKAPASAEPAGTLETHPLHCPIREAFVVAPARGGLMLGANGSVFLYHRETEAIERAVMQLRRGEPVRFDDLAGDIGEPARSVVAAVVRDAIRAAGALSLVPSAAAVS